MADLQPQQVIMLDASALEEQTEIVTVAHDSDIVVREVNEDILQQALEEASNGFDEGTVQYVTEQAVVAAPVTGVVETESNSHGTHIDSVSIADENATAFTYVTTDVDHTQHVQELHSVPQNVSAPVNTTGTTTVMLSNSFQDPHHDHLGSSINPIRIIQQGNQYTSMQQLSSEQLSQIMQVVQQQQLAKSAQEGGGSSILYNPQTQTRIVYRVIYPSELHNKNSGSSSTALQGTSKHHNLKHTVKFTTEPPQKRTYRKRNREDEEKLESPELSKEEKAERKKHRPRTRSGRVSKPPKHMVKDYKHIHVLDWDEDYDDSDGGYSDIQLSEGDEDDSVEPKNDSNDTAYVQTGLPSSKPRNYKCPVCQKAYIGRAGLGRHYKLTGHGVLEKEEKDMNSGNQNNPTANGLDSQGDDSSSLPGQPDSTSLVSQEQMSTESSKPIVHHVAPVTSTTDTSNPRPVSTTPVAKANSQVAKGALRIKTAYMQENTPVRRKARLKELVRQCEDEELMEVVLPRLAKVITCWEFLMMKVEKGRPLKPHFPDVYREFEMLHRQVQKMCQEYLFVKQSQIASDTNNTENKLQVSNEAVAKSLGFSVGTYDVRESPSQDDSLSFQYKLLTTDPASLCVTGQTTKRTIEVVSPDEMVVQSGAKRMKLPQQSPVTAASEASTTSMTSTDNSVLELEDTPSVKPNSALSTGSDRQLHIIVQTGSSDSQIDNVFRTKTSECQVTESTHDKQTKQSVLSVSVSDDSTNSRTESDDLSHNTVECKMETLRHIETDIAQEKTVSDESQSETQDCQPIENEQNAFSDSVACVQPSNTDQVKTDLICSEDFQQQSNNTLSQLTDSAISENPVTTEHSENSQQANSDEAVQDDSSLAMIGDIDRSVEVRFQTHDVEAAEAETDVRKDALDTNLIVPHENEQISISNVSDIKANTDDTNSLTEMHTETVDEQPKSFQQVISIHQENKANNLHADNAEHQMAVVVDNEVIGQTTDDTQQRLIFNVNEECYITGDDGSPAQVLVHEGEMLQVANHVNSQASIIQTSDGAIYIQNPDGTTFQLQHNDQDIPLETVQALLTMESEALIHSEHIIENVQELPQD